MVRSVRWCVLGLGVAVVLACGSSHHGDDDDDAGEGGDAGAEGATGGRAGSSARGGGSGRAGSNGGGGTAPGGGSSGTGAGGSGGVAGDEPGAGAAGQPGLGGSGEAGAGVGGGLLEVLDLSGLDRSELAYPPPPGVEAARAEAAEIVAGMTPEQKFALLHGAGGGIVGGIAASGPIPALGMNDGPGGVSNLSGVTAFPAPITLAATWNRELVERWGVAMGAEQRGKGVAVQLGPMMNLSRVPLAGRNFEGFGEDPVLSAELSAKVVLGIQSNKIVATAKHFVANEQETNRETESSVVDERTLHEIYYLPFEASVSAGVGAVMCSYNLLNGIHACENAAALADLKDGLGFSGWVMTDWNASHGSGAAAAGLDQEMPSTVYFSQSALSNLGTRFDDMATRVVTSLVRVGLLDDPPTGDSGATVRTDEHTALALEAATEGITLLKNEGGALPLGDDVKSIVVLGTAGDYQPFSTGSGAAHVIAPYVTSPFEAIVARAPSDTTVSYVQGDIGDEADAVVAAEAADAAVIVLSVASSEFTDRTSLSLPSAQTQLIAAVAAVNPRTIVVLDVPGAVLMPWASEVSGLVVAWYPGQENGTAVASVLFGDANPSGKLPVSFPESAGALPYPETGLTINYAEGLSVGYRAFDVSGIDPLFEFGFGLSYTTYEYGALELRSGASSGSVDVSFDLANTGDRDGTEISQVYLGFPASAGEPPRVLRGFERTTLEAGETRRVHIELPARAFACWDPVSHARFAPSGSYRIEVGSSSRALPLTATFEVTGIEPP